VIFLLWLFFGRYPYGYESSRVYGAFIHF